MTQKSQSLFNRTLTHEPQECPLVARRIACFQCGYPYSEAIYHDAEEYESLFQWPVFDEAKGG